MRRKYQEENMNPLIQMTFKSETPAQVYHLLINSLKEAIQINVNNPEKLEEIRLEIMESLAIVNHLQFSNKTKGGY